MRHNRGVPTPSLRALTDRHRTRLSNQRLGILLAFVAGAMNAGGFLLLHRYTSHMTGIVSGLADDLALGARGLVAMGLGLVASFVLGALITALLANWARRRDWRGEYAPCLAVEGLLLITFAAITFEWGDSVRAVAGATALLCLVMGLQNAMVTKVSRAEIRTTHVTGILTDIGIELGRGTFRLLAGAGPGDGVRLDAARLGLLSSLLGAFVLGGIAGAFSFKWVGALAAVPVGIGLLLLAVPSLFRDLRSSAAR
jgi:uncharacterized membrane protein YoaK (UPF0700 family)